MFIRILFLVAVLMASLAQSPPPAPYKNPNLGVDERVTDLLKRMTLEEKLAQIGAQIRRVPN